MDWHWSATRAAFYPGSLRKLYEDAGGWPADAEPVSDGAYDAVHQPEHMAMPLAADEHGKPVRITAPTATPG